MKNNTILEQIVPNVKVLNALRNSGYNNYTAIADIVDNSLEDDVEATKIIIRLPNKKDPFDFIKICDNGCGMEKAALKEAITLGSHSSKDLTTDLGCYGTGLKSASLSIGKRLVVKTKSANDVFYMATFDMDELYEKNNWAIPIEEGSESEYKIFKDETGSETGTVIQISKLDRLTNSSIDQFTNILTKRLGLTFRYFIDEKNVDICINSEKIQSIDPMMRNEHYSKRLSELNETFEYENKKFTFNAYYLDPNFKNEIDATGMKRNSEWSGLYIYRNLRLVGFGVGLGIYPKYGDGYSNGGRIELFINGEDDKLFSSNFNKIITEKDIKEIEQGFKDSISNTLKTYVGDIRNRDKRNSTEKKQAIADEQRQIFDDIDKGINTNKTLTIPKIKGVNEKPNIKKEHPVNPRGEQKNPNPKKKRDDIWYKTLFEKMGEYGKVFDIRVEEGFHVVIINTDHPFWIEFLSTAPQETQKMFVNWFSSSSIALWSLKYTISNEEEMKPEHLIDAFHEKLSSELRKMILF